MRLLLPVLFSITLMILVLPEHKALAVTDPLAVTNNKFGIHILFDSELEEATRLVNSNGGDWGYVVIPLQSGDKDREKWQAFMDKASELHIIPIVRIATENYYFNTKVWRKPKPEDILDFANFLNSLEWPIENRYIIVFNEVNRNDEWGGETSPREYAEILSYASTVFKSLNANFYIISAGLDNASINGSGAYNKLTFLTLMQQAVPGIFDQIDGISAHAYPNPGFSQPPSATHATSIASFRFERSLIAQYTKKKLPIFITETGWSNKQISEEDRASYYKDAIANTWSDEDIVAIAPFLLRASIGPFQEFSFLSSEGSPTKQYEALVGLAKQKGQPVIGSVEYEAVLGDKAPLENVPSIWFPEPDTKTKFSVKQAAVSMFDWFFGL